jgi:hypothetical protein
LRFQLRFYLLTASFLAVFLAGQPTAGQKESAATARPAASEEEIIQRIIDLRQQIEDLLSVLPPEVQEEVERRWRDQQAVSAPTPEAGSESRETAMEATMETEPVPPAPEQQTELPTAETAEALPPCGGFLLFDTNGDGLISGADRQWRFVRLWFDAGDGTLEETELESLFDLGVRQIDVGLRFYTNVDGDSEDVDAGDVIELTQVGRGNATRRRGALVIEADRLARGGVLVLIDSDGNSLSGYQPLGSGTLLADGDDVHHPLVCSEMD